MNEQLNELDISVNTPKKQLISRLLEAEATLNAIRSGEVDAFIVSGPKGDQVYTLRDADHPYRMIVEEMNEGAITMNDGSILYSNQCFAKMLKFPLEKIIGSQFYDYLQANERNKFKTLLKDAREHKASRGEFTLIAGESPAAQVQIAVSQMKLDGFEGFCIIVTDLTELRRKEVALEKWAKIFEHTKWGIAIRSSDGQTLEMINPAFVRMYGYTVKELMEKPIYNLLTSGSPQEVETNTRLAKEKGRHIFESVHRRKDGTDFPVQVDLTAVKDDDGKAVLFYVMNVQDITEEKKTEALNNEILERKKREQILHESESQLRTLSIQLERSNKDLEQFAYAAAHDLKSPLRIIKMYSQLLQRRYQNPEAQEFIETIISSANDLDNLTTALLNYARVQKGHEDFKEVDCETVLDKALLNLGIDIKESGAQVVRGPLSVVVGDKTLLVQLFQNLISNALKFRSTETPRIQIACSGNNQECVFAISDNGVGIRGEDKEKIFELFSRTKTDIEGSGIGLATCKKIVEIHGGKIWVESTGGKGSTFYVSIPKKPTGR
jgi:PAS domain S-box-containing protein